MNVAPYWIKTECRIGQFILATCAMVDGIAGHWEAAALFCVAWAILELAVVIFHK